MRITQVYVGETLIAEYPDTIISQGEYWTHVYPNGMSKEDKNFVNALITIPVMGHRSPQVSVISVLQGAEDERSKSVGGGKISS